MGSGIFRRIFLTNVAIVLGVLLTVAFTSTLFTNWYYQTQEQKQLEAQGVVVCSQIAAYLRGTADVGQVQQVVDALASTTATQIMVLQVSPNNTRLLQQQLQAVKSEKDIARIYAQVLKGEQVVEHRSFFFPYQTSVLLVAQPVKIDQQVKAVVFLYTPLKASVDTLKGFYRIIWGTATVALLIAAGVVYTVSRRLIKPLSDMAVGARALARGEVVDDFPAQHKDEIADLAAAFNQMKRELARTEQIRRDLVTDVSHELRTPLTSVRGFIQAILDGVVAPEQEKKYLKLAYDELQRMTALVKDLLDLSRLQAGTMRIDQQRINLATVAERAVLMLELQANAAQVAIEISAKAPVLVLGDSDRMGQIAINLLQNAISYSPAGGLVRVQVDQVLGQALLAVSDSGSGIDAAELPYIFDRFKRGDNSVKGGTGVGLAIVKALVEIHGGHLEVLSGAGTGTEIRVWLPLLTVG
ncbi:MAG: sensor histidine kinase [Methylocystaceae bacterium]